MSELKSHIKENAIVREILYGSIGLITNFRFCSLPCSLKIITLTGLQKLVAQLYICTYQAHKACIRLA